MWVLLVVAAIIGTPATATRTTLNDTRTVIELTNNIRTVHGLPPLTHDLRLDAAAVAHANDQRDRPCTTDTITHEGSDGSHADTRITRTGIPFKRWAENIGCHAPTPTTIVQAWYLSPTHRTNILNPQHTHTGTAVSWNNTGTTKYWVQTFTGTT